MWAEPCSQMLQGFEIGGSWGHAVNTTWGFQCSGLWQVSSSSSGNLPSCCWQKAVHHPAQTGRRCWHGHTHVRFSHTVCNTLFEYERHVNPSEAADFLSGEEVWGEFLWPHTTSTLWYAHNGLDFFSRVCCLWCRVKLWSTGKNRRRVSFNFFRELLKCSHKVFQPLTPAVKCVETEKPNPASSGCSAHLTLREHSKTDFSLCLHFSYLCKQSFQDEDFHWLQLVCMWTGNRSF